MDRVMEMDRVAQLGAEVLWLKHEIAAVQVFLEVALIGMVISLTLIGWSWIAWRRKVNSISRAGCGGACRNVDEDLWHQDIRLDHIERVLFGSSDDGAEGGRKDGSGGHATATDRAIQ